MEIIAIILLISSLPKVAIALTALRHGLGLHGAVFGLALFSLCLATSISSISQLGDVSSSILGNSKLELSQSKIETFLNQKLEKDDYFKTSLSSVKSTIAATKGNDSNFSEFNILVLSNVIAELSKGIKLSLFILLPFILIDLLIGFIISALKLDSLSPELIALPLKLLCFVTVGGFTRLLDGLI